jgi:hypothetical protein
MKDKEEIGTYEQAVINLEDFVKEVNWHRPLAASADDITFGRRRRCHEFILKDEATGMRTRVQIPWCKLTEAWKAPVYVDGAKHGWTKAVDEVREMLRPTHTIP